MASQRASISARHLFELLLEIRETKPLVLNVTNFVAMNFTANSLLALGASPVMAHSQDEIKEMVSKANSLVVNIGTLDLSWISNMKFAIHAAKEVACPLVVDPVGAGATSFRTKTAQELARLGASVIRGNASEILAMNGLEARTRGVDSDLSSQAGLQSARDLAEFFHCVVCVSGETDVIIEKDRAVFLNNGHPLMARVTAMGCAASALIGAYLAVEKNMYLATQAAMGTMAVAGEIAATMARGPGTFQIQFLDALYSLKFEDFEERLRFESDI